MVIIRKNEDESYQDYCENDVIATIECAKHFGIYQSWNTLEIKKVIFDGPATIVLWNDGTKTVVKNYDDDYDSEKGLAMAFSKKLFGNKGSYYEQFKKWLPTY